MRTKIYAALLIAVAVIGCKKDYLEKPPLDQLADETFWSSENNVRTFSYGFYTSYFTGYGSGNTWGNYFSGQSLNDDFAPTTPTEYVRIVPASGGGWTFTYVRKENLFLQRVQNMTVLTDEAKNHWLGVGRFFRALEYGDLVKRFGDVPYYEQVIDEKDNAMLYKQRDPRTLVSDKILADFKYAAENVRAVDGKDKQAVNKYVVLAYMSRVMLFEASWQKYHLNNLTKANEYFEAAKWAAGQVIAANKYSLGNYRDVFSSLDLAGNPEVILFRQYVSGILTHSLMSYNNREAQTGGSKDLIESYLAADGLPIKVSPLYQGDANIAKVMANRDGRIQQTFVQQLKLNGETGFFSTSGYSSHKFLNESLKDLVEATLANNQTDAPIIRYGEVLVNYAEACAELGNLTNADLDKSINVLRKRQGVNLPNLQVVGLSPAVNNVVYDDPERDPTVPSLIWEIRRERRVELVFEGFRWDDLRRWKKLEYTDTQTNPDINAGAYIKKSEHPLISAVVVLNKNQAATEGYITPAWRPESQRTFTDPKIYLSPLPQDQIVLYKQQGGVDLKQNPGW